MTESIFAEMVRQFPENGMKLLLSNPLNVRDLLHLADPELVELIDLKQLKPLPTNLVKRDYRHVECDVVLSAPFRSTKGVRGVRSLLLYILVEHQSKPDWLMPLRILDYLVQIYWSQFRGGGQGRSFTRRKLHPVLPIVLYTGTKRWNSLGSLADLVGMGDRFASVTPSFEPLFVNLGEIPAERLAADGGFFGWALRLVRERNARTREYEDLLGHVVRELETMPERDRLRWLELLSYVRAAVYHYRSPEGQPRMQETIEASVQTDYHRKEAISMGMSAA